MNPDLLLSALRARSRVFMLVLAATVLVTTVVSLLMPKSYVATADMLVDSKDEQSMSNSAEGHVRERIGYMQTQLDIITSEKVARKVVDELGLADLPASRQAFEKETNGEGAIEDWLTTSLLKQLKVDTSQSSVIRIAYTSVDPQFSALVANAFAKAYMETTLELRVEPSRQTAAWFDEQMQGLHANLEQAQARLNEFQKANGIVDERFDVEDIALTNMANQLARLEARRKGIDVPENIVSSAVQNVRSDLARSESKLQEMSLRLGVNHPLYQRQLAETRLLRARLQSEIGLSNGLSAQRYSRQRESDLRKALEAQQAKVLDMKQARYQVGILSRDVEMAQKAYETALQHSVDKRVESRASLTNVSLLHAAVAPFKASRPIVTLNIGLSFVVGSLLGLCIIYLMEMFDHRVRSLGDLKNEFPVPVLAELSTWQPAPLKQLGMNGRLPGLPNPG